MNSSEIAVVVALVAGSLRSVKIWRAAAKVSVINVVVLGTLAQGRSRDLPGLLRGGGTSAYRSVAQAVAESALRLSREISNEEVEERRRLSVRETREQLERDAARAVIAAARRAGVDTGLDAVLLTALVFAGVNAAVNSQATGVLALGLVAATLLWISNVWGSRSHVTRMYEGAMTLADGLTRSLDNLESFAMSQAGGPNENEESEPKSAGDLE